MENITKDHIKKVIEKLNKPATLPELAKMLDLEKPEEVQELEKFLKENREEIDIKIIEVPTSNSKENNIEYVLEYKYGDERDEYEHLSDEELLKTYHNLIFKANKLKDQKSKLENTELKAKFIKALHKYNELKDIGQAILGKLAEFQNKTLNEVYEDFNLDLSD